MITATPADLKAANPPRPPEGRNTLERSGRRPATVVRRRHSPIRCEGLPRPDGRVRTARGSQRHDSWISSRAARPDPSRSAQKGAANLLAVARPPPRPLPPLASGGAHRRPRDGADFYREEVTREVTRVSDTFLTSWSTATAAKPPRPAKGSKVRERSGRCPATVVRRRHSPMAAKACRGPTDGRERREVRSDMTRGFRHEPPSPTHPALRRKALRTSRRSRLSPRPLPPSRATGFLPYPPTVPTSTARDPHCTTMTSTLVTPTVP